MIVAMYCGPGIPEYNCFINANKTVKNFDVTENGEAIINTDGMCNIMFITFVSPCGHELCYVSQ